MKLIHVAQHTSSEYLGLIEDHLEGRGIRFRYYRPFAERGGLPMPVTVRDGLILLGGGPWGSAGVRDLPTLEREVQLTRNCLGRGVPVVGIGLGAQILAIAAGGGSEAAPLECSTGDASRTDASALGGLLPETYPIATYMRDRAHPPVDARIHARDASGRPALWQVGANSLGFSGHPGLKVAMVEDLVMEFDESPPAFEKTLVRLRALQRRLEDALVPIMTGVIGVTGWMD
ncbi:MAG TPA: gamma-glutamyl-gamma-aminobutyrate hydrolase family protein [Casimicrobiaceae bacterium]|nr:gamma-glutamyl-gamma-aminobutyrate hydrolase family protein [Casimicrobiaceae bacterium]